MTAAKGRIDRSGAINFGDASLSIWEEGLNSGMSFEQRDAWERTFKREVFARVAQALRRLGWSCAVPAIDPHSVKHYGANVARWSAERHRQCSKGDLKGELEITGRVIKFEMWQGVNTPTRPDHGGRYESNKEACMPYVLRLEMERSRRRIRDYLCNVFTGYSFDAESRSIYRKPLALTALECIQRRYAESWHFKGDLTKYTISDYNRGGADGALIEHGQRVWFRDEYTGRAGEGIAYYNINNMWWVLTGRYDYRNIACFRLHSTPPDSLRGRHFPDRRRKRLEQELARAIKAMDFDRAKVLRDVLFPPGTGPLFHVRVKKDGLLWGPNHSGYTHDSVDAGKYTADEARQIVRGAESLEAVEVAA